MKIRLGALRVAVLTFTVLWLALTTACVTDMSPPGYSVTEIFADPKIVKLSEAAASGDTREIDRLVSQGVPFDTPGKYGLTPLWWAARNKNLAGFRNLLDHGASLNRLPTERVYSVMDLAAGMEKSDFLREALKHKVDINQVSPRDGRTPFGRTIENERIENFRLLIASGCDLNFEDGWGETPSVTAAVHSRYDFVLELLKAGADGAKVTSYKRSLIKTLSGNFIDPDGEQYVWRERVLRFLASKGIEAHRPYAESPRTKPLPADFYSETTE